MKLLEYKSKEILKSYNLPVPTGFYAENISTLTSILSNNSIQSGVLKAQVYTGGRGKAGGIKV
ncbi:MAG: ATP-grasp domain-containing protein, partial [Bacteroidales bacterium]